MHNLRENHKEFLKNNRLILKSQQRFRSKKHNIFTAEINKIAWSANADKRIQSIDSVETYAYGTNKEIIDRKKEMKCNSIIKQYQNWLTMTILQRKQTKMI